jgi:uncharacterized protein
MKDLAEKYTLLKEQVRQLGSLIVAYSGGIDSTLVLKVARDELGQNAAGVTSDSPSVPRWELREAAQIAREIGARHIIVKTNEVDNSDYAENPTNRCYFCKSELYTHLTEVARREGVRHIANGTNLDDLGDYRPGLQAADEFEIVSPLRDAGLTKADVRLLARKLGLRIWDKPASPCLASRIPYGTAVTRERLAMVEQAEAFLRSYRLRVVRVRHMNDTARIEVNPEDMSTIRNNLGEIETRFYEIGFSSVELREFRSGALNVGITISA